MINDQPIKKKEEEMKDNSANATDTVIKPHACCRSRTACAVPLEIGHFPNQMAVMTIYISYFSNRTLTKMFSLKRASF